MWLDFDLPVAAARGVGSPYPVGRGSVGRSSVGRNMSGGSLAFDFPSLESPGWRQLWQAIVGHVAVTATPDAKEALLDEFASGRGVRTLGFVNAHALNKCVDDAGFARDLLGLDKLVRDGIGVHALYRLVGSQSGLNLNGTDMLPELIGRFAGRRVALFGTQQDIVDIAADMLRRDLGCDVITADGFQPDGYYLKLVEQTRPALVVLGMGMPKQERVARFMKHAIHDDVAVVCGGAIIDFLSGNKPRAPRWIRKIGFEWAFRLGLEPKRLFTRYVIGNPLFLLRSAILAGRPAPTETRTSAPPERRPAAKPFGIGGPVARMTTAASAVRAAAVPAAASLPVPGAAPPPAALPSNAMPLAAVPASAPTTMPLRPPVEAAAGGRPATSVFSANRPVAGRHDLFGRERDVDRLLAWVLDQSGNALIYGPRGYGKTSLVRVFGEVADARGHIVLYASCSRGIDFDSLMRLYLGEIPTAARPAMIDAGAPLTVHQVASQLAMVADASIVIIIDEFDRIERDDTRHSIVELIKDCSDLTAAVRFVLVGVATDATAILGYHPSVQRCITCVPLARLAAPAIESLFRRKAAADGMIIGDADLQTIVTLAAGSAYHAQLIGQKLVSRLRQCDRDSVEAGDLDQVIDDVVFEATLMDDGLARLARAMRQPEIRDGLLSLARLALSEPDDAIHMQGGTISEPLARLCDRLVQDKVLRLSTLSGDEVSFRFANAFLPQLLLMIGHRSAGAKASADAGAGTSAGAGSTLS